MNITKAESGHHGTQPQERENQNARKGLHNLFVDELKRIYWAEKELLIAIPKMIKNATSPGLKKALTGHWDITEEHVTRIEEIFSFINEEVETKKCILMEGLIKVAGQIMENTENGTVRDAGIILVGQKVEHHEIATDSTLFTFAKTLGNADAADLLMKTLDKEKEADEKLSEIAESDIHIDGEDADDADANKSE